MGSENSARGIPTANGTASKPSIVIIGAKHKRASVDLRERIAFSGDTLTGGLRALREHVDEGLIASTCDRTELYIVVDDPDAGRERTFAWLGRYRRLSKDYEYLAATEEARIYLAMTQLMVRRLAR